jgi:hypothetical protein
VTFGLADNGMIGCALFKNGEFVAISLDGTFNNVDIDPAKDALTIRAANQRGGFGPEGPVLGTLSAVNAIMADNNASDAIYNLQGIRVKNVNKGIYIMGGKKVIVK